MGLRQSCRLVAEPVVVEGKVEGPGKGIRNRPRETGNN